MSERSRESDRGETGNTNEEDAERAVESALRNGPRRRVVRHLCEEGGRASLMSLAFRLQSDEGRTMPDAISTLHDLHLPKLEKHGVVERVGDSTVALDVEPERVEAYLDDRTDS